MLAVTTGGHCGRIPIGLGISHGRIFSTGGRFARYPIQLAGRVSASGEVWMNAVAGPRSASGTGRFNRVQGRGRALVPPASALAFGPPFAFETKRGCVTDAIELLQTA